jgi:hypothetical protein
MTVRPTFWESATALLVAMLVLAVGGRDGHRPAAVTRAPALVLAASCPF